MDAAKKMLEDRQGLMTTLFASLEAMQKCLGISCQFISINLYASWSDFLKLCVFIHSSCPCHTYQYYIYSDITGVFGGRS